MPLDTIMPVNPELKRIGAPDYSIMPIDPNLPKKIGAHSDSSVIGPTPPTGLIGAPTTPTPTPTPTYNSTPSTTSTDSKPITPITAPPRPAEQNWNVTDNQTVEARVKGLIDANSPLMQQAATTGLQQANARGLMNSSMAVGASQAEVLKAAVPIATADANIQANAAQFNATSPAERMARLNIDADMTKLTAQLESSKNLSDADRSALKDRLMTEITSREGLSNADRQALSQRLDTELASRERIATMENDARFKLADADNKYKLLISNNQGAASLYDTYQKAVQMINSNDKLDTANKQKALDDQFAILQAGLKMYQDTEGLNIDEIINPPNDSAVPGAGGPGGNPGQGDLLVKQQDWDNKKNAIVKPPAPQNKPNFSGGSSPPTQEEVKAYEKAMDAYYKSIIDLGPRPA